MTKITLAQELEIVRNVLHFHKAVVAKGKDKELYKYMNAIPALESRLAELEGVNQYNNFGSFVA